MFAFDASPIDSGRTHFQNVEEFCIARDCSKIMLLSSISRVNAHRFFERPGLGSDSKRGFVKYRRHFSPARQ